MIDVFEEFGLRRRESRACMVAKRSISCADDQGESDLGWKMDSSSAQITDFAFSG